MRVSSWVLVLALIVLWLCATGAASPAGEIDLTTGLPATGGEVSQPPAPQGGAPASIGVLWDLTHGVYYDYKPDGGYSQLVSRLGGTGCAISTTDAGLENTDLSAYRAIVICLGSAWSSAYTPGEVEVVRQFVNAGGGLLIMGDNADCPNGNINPVAQAFGITAGVSDLLPYDLYFSNFSTHPIFAGCSSLYYRAAGGLTAAPPGQLAAWTGAGQGVVATSGFGSGRVVVLGDINFWENDYLSRTDNLRFADNVFGWLTPVPEPSSLLVLLTGVGGVGGLVWRRRR